MKEKAPPNVRHAVPVEGGAQADPRQILFYDGECVLCNGSVALTIRLDRRGLLKHAALQGKTAGSLLGHMSEEERMAGVIFYDRGRVYQGPFAIARLGSVLFPLLFFWTVPFLSIPGIKQLVGWVYRIIARNRYRWFGKYDVCRLPRPELRERYIVD